MKFRGIILMMSIWTLAFTASAQMRIISRDRVDEVSNPRLSADSASVIFDVMHIIADPMNEDDAPKNFVYTLKNVGKETLEIVRLVSTCSCATATCPVRHVAPGESAQINVRYNPKGHPGRFERKIFVYTQEGNNPAAVLKLAVDVSNGSGHAVLWPVQMGGIRLRTTEVAFDKDKKSVETVSFINLTGKTLKIDCETMFLPECLTFFSEAVENGCEGTMRIAYDPTKPGVRENVNLILKGLGLPPSKSSITIRIK